MKPAIFFSAFILFNSSVLSQQKSFAYDTVVINLAITNYDGKPIVTKVNIENRATHKITSCTTDKEGKGICKLATDGSYSITIPKSADSYEYNIPDISITPVDLVFKFHTDP